MMGRMSLPSSQRRVSAGSDRNSADPFRDTNSTGIISNEAARRRLCPRIIQNQPNTLLALGEILRKRWEIKGLIGSGGYGQIYYALDKSSGENVAVKAEPKERRGKTVRRMILEHHVLIRLQGQPHVPSHYGSGCDHDVNFIVMQLLSVNLGDLRKQSPLRRLSCSTVSRVMLQSIAAIRDLHNIGYLHRDIKPANMCFGITEGSKHRLFVVDYGLARAMYHHNGNPRRLRPRAGFRGTARYVSLRVHLKQEQGPADDLVALFYSMLELLRSRLPWLEAPNHDAIYRAKRELRDNDFLQIAAPFGEQIREFGRAVYEMSSTDLPNYSALQQIITEFNGNHSLSDPYDWENEFADVLAEEEINRELRLIS